MNVNKTNKKTFLKYDILFLITNIVILFCVLILLNGCAEKEVLIQREQVNKVPLDLKNADEIKLNDISYVVITDKNSQNVFSEMKKENKEPVLYAVTSEDYQNLVLNLAKIKKYIIDQQQILNAYREYYEPIKKDAEPQKLEINVNKN